MKRNLRRSTSKMMAGMMITMSIFSDVSVNAQDISTDAFDAVDAILSDDSADSSVDDSSESADSGSDESADSNENAESSESADSNESAEDSDSAEDSENAEGSESADSNESAEGSESADSNENAEGSESADSNESAESSESADSNESAEGNEGSESANGNENIDNSSSSSSSSSSEDEDKTEEETTEEVEETTEKTVEETTEETTEKIVEETTEETTEKIVEETTEETTASAAEETTTEITTEKEADIEKTGGDILGGVIDEKDEAEDVIAGIGQTITVYKSVEDDGTVVSANAFKYTLPNEIITSIKNLNAKNGDGTDTTITGNMLGYKIQWVDDSNDADVKITAADIRATNGTFYNGELTLTDTVTKTITEAAPLVLRAQVIDDSGASPVVKFDNVYKVRVKAVNSKVTSGSIGTPGTTEGTSTDTSPDAIGIAKDFVNVKAGSKKTLSIEVDKDFLNDTDNNSIKWEVFNTNTNGALTDNTVKALAISEGSNTGAEKIDSSNTITLTNGKYVNTINLEGKKIGTAYLKATIGSIVVYQGRINVGLNEESIIPIDYQTYQGKVEVKFELPKDYIDTTTPDNVTWTLKETTATNLLASTNCKVGAGSTEDGTTALSPTTAGEVTVSPIAVQKVTTDGNDKYYGVIWLDLTGADKTDNNPDKALQLTASIGDAEVYKANLSINEKPNFVENKSDLTNDAAKHQVTITNRTDLKVGGDSVKIDIDSLKGKNIIGDIEWNVYKSIMETDTTNHYVSATGKSLAAASTTNEVLLSDSETFAAAATAQVTNDKDGSIYIKAPAGAKTSAYYVEAKLNGVVVYLGKVYVSSINDVTTVVDAMPTGSQPKTFSFKVGTSDVTINPDDANEQSIEWKLKYYTLDSNNNPVESSNYTDGNAANPTTYFQFVASPDGKDAAIAQNAPSGTIDANSVAEVEIKSTSTITPDKSFVMLVGSVKGVEVHKWKLTSHTIGATTEDSQQINFAKTEETGVKLETVNLGSSNYEKIDWQVYKDSGYSQPENSDTDAIVQLSKEPKKKLSSGSIVSGSQSVTMQTGKSMIDPATNIGYVYAHSTGKTGVAYVKGTIDGVEVYKGKIEAAQNIKNVQKITIYNGQSYTLSATLDNDSYDGQNVEWKTFSDPDYKTAITGSPLSADDYVIVGGGSAPVANNVLTKVEGNKVSVNIKANSANDTVANTSYVAGYVGGSMVCKAEINAIKKPYKYDATASPKVTTDVAGTGILADSNDNGYYELKVSASSAPQTKNITLTGFGNVTEEKIIWKVYGKDTSGYGDKEDNSIVTVSNTPTAISSGMTELGLTIKQNAAGSVLVKGISERNPEITLYEFEVIVAPISDTVVSEAKNIYTKTSDSVEHRFEAELPTDLQSQATGKTINWTITDTSGGTTITPETGGTAPAVIPTKSTDIYSPSTNSKIYVTISEKNCTAAYLVSAYIGDPKDKIKIYEFAVKPVAAPAAVSTVDKKNIQIGSTTPAKLETPDLGGYNFNDVKWKVTTDSSYNKDATNSIVQLNSELDTTNVPNNSNNIAFSTKIDASTKKATLYAYANGAKELGKVYIKAEVDGVDVYHGEIQVCNDVSEDKIKKVTVFDGESYDIVADDLKGVTDKDEVVWKVMDSAYATATGAAHAGLKLGGAAQGQASTKVEKVTVTGKPDTYKTTLKISVENTTSANTAISTAYIAGFVNDAIVYKAKIDSAKRNYEPASAGSSTAVASFGTIADTDATGKGNNNGLVELKLKASSTGGTSKVVTISSLGDKSVTDGNVIWTIQKRTETGYSDAEDTSLIKLNKVTDAANVAGSPTVTTPIEGSSTSLKITTIGNQAGIVKLKGVSDKNSSLVLYEFEVVVAPTAAEENLNLVTATSAKTHRIDFTLPSDISNIVDNKNVSWKVNLTGTPPAGAPALVADSCSKTAESGEKLHATITETNYTTPFTLSAYLGNAVDGIEIYKLNITGVSVAAPTATTPEKRNISADSTLPIKLETGSLGGHNFKDVKWYVTADNTYGDTIDPTKTVAVLGKVYEKTTVNANNHKVSIEDGTVDATTNTSCIYLFPESAGNYGKAYVKAVLDGEIVYKGEISVGKIVSPVEEKVIYTGQEITLKVPVSAAENTKVEWTQTLSTTGATDSSFILGNSSVGSSSYENKTIKEGSSQVYATLKVKAGDTAVGTANYITALIGGSEVYKVSLKSIAINGMDTTTKLVSSLDEDTTPSPDPSNDKLDTSVDDADNYTVTISNLGDVTDAKINWGIYKKDSSGAATEEIDATSMQISDNATTFGTTGQCTTIINGGSSTLYLKKLNKIGSAVVVGKIEGTDTVLYKFDVSVNPSANAMVKVNKDIFKDANLSYKLEGSINVAAGSPLADIVGKEIEWEFTEDGSSSGKANVDASSTSIVPAAVSNVTNLTAVLNVTAALDPTKEYEVTAKLKNSNVKILQFKINAYTAPTAETTETNMPVTKVNVNNGNAKIETAPLGGSNFEKAEWKLYGSYSSGTFGNELLSGSSIAQIGDSASLGDDETYTNGGVDSATGKQYIYVAPSSKPGIGKAYIQATIAGKPIYNGIIKLDTGSDVTGSNVKVICDDNYIIKTPDLKKDCMVTWEELDGTNPKQDFLMNSQAVSTLKSKATKDDSGKYNSSITVTAGSTAATRTFVAKVDDVKVYEVQITSVAVGTIGTNLTDGKIELIASDSNPKAIELSGLPIVDGNGSNITWTIEGKKQDNTFGKDIEIVKITDDKGVVAANSTTTVNADGTAKLYIKPVAHEAGTTPSTYKDLALGVVKFTGKIGNAPVYDFQAIIKPESSSVGKVVKQIYDSTANYELKGKLNESIRSGNSQALFGKGRENITWKYDSSKIEMDEAASSNIVTDGMITGTTSGGTTTYDDIVFKIKSVKTVTNGEHIPIEAYIGNENDGIKIFEFDVIIAEAPTLTPTDWDIKSHRISDTTAFEIPLENIMAGLNGQQINWKLYNDSAAQAANEITSQSNQNILIGASAGSENITATTAITNSATGDTGATKLVVKPIGCGEVFAKGTVTVGSKEITVAQLRLIVYKDSVIEEKEVAVGNSSTTVAVTENTYGKAITSAADATNVKWESGSYEGKKESINTNIVALTSNPSTDKNGLSEISSTNSVSVITKSIGSGFVRAIETDTGNEICRYNFKVVEKPNVSEGEINTKVNKDESYKVTGLGNITPEVDWAFYESDGTTSAASKFTLTNPTTPVSQGSTSVSFKAGKTAALYEDASYYLIGTTDSGDEVARVKVNVKVETIDAVELNVAKDKPQQIDFSIAGVSNVDTDADKVKWTVGKYSGEVEVPTANVIQLGDSTDTTVTTDKITSSNTSAEVELGTADANGMYKVHIKVTGGNVGDRYFIKGVLNGKEVYKAHITMTEKEATGGVTIVPVDKMYMGIEEAIAKSDADGKYYKVGTLTPAFDDNGTLDQAKCVEGDLDNSVIEFTMANSEHLETSKPTSANDIVTIKGVSEGWAYVKEFNSSNEVTKKWYINIVETPVSDIKFADSKLIENSKTNGFKDITTDANRTAHGNADRVYEVNLYENDGSYKDNNLISKSLSQIAITPIVLDQNGKTVAAKNDRQLEYTYNQDTNNSTPVAELTQNKKGEYIIKINEGGSALSGTDVVYIQTTIDKAMGDDGNVSSSGHEIPVKKIAIKIVQKKIESKNVVNGEKDYETGKTYSDISAGTALSLPTKYINENDILRIRFDGAKAGVRRVKKAASGYVDDNETGSELTITTPVTGLPRGKWIICANEFKNDSTSNSKTSSAAKLSTDGSNFRLTSVEDASEIYLGNTKSKGNNANKIYLRYVNPYDSNIVYVQIPISIAPSETKSVELSAKNTENITGADSKQYSLLTATMGAKSSVKVSVTGSNNKDVTYSFGTAGVEADTGFTVVNGDEYIQINNSGVITPIKPTPVDETTKKPSYVKLIAKSVDNPSATAGVMYIKVESGKVSSLVLSQTSVSVAKDKYQNVVLRVNPAYEGSTTLIDVDIPENAPFEVYTKLTEDGNGDITGVDATSKVDTSTGPLTISNGMQNFYIKIVNDTALTKENSVIKFINVEQKTNESGTAEYVPTSVKPASLTVKKVNSVSNVSAVVQKQEDEFYTPVGVPCDLKTNVNPATAENVIDWTVNTIAADGTESAAAASDYVITNGWFIPLEKKDFKLSGKTLGVGASGSAVDLAEYTIHAYVPIKSLQITGSESSDTYYLYKGYLVNENQNGSNEIKGGKTITVTVKGDGTNDPSEPIEWTTNSSLGLPLVETANRNGAEFKITPNTAGTYTVTGISKYSKQKFTFKVVVVDNLNIAGANQNIKDNLKDFATPADVEFKLGTAPLTDVSKDTGSCITLKKGDKKQIIATSKNVAFSNIAFSLSSPGDSKYISVSASGAVTAKAETPEDKIVYITVKMTGKALNSEDNKVNVTIEKKFAFKVGPADITIANVEDGNYIAGEYFLPEKNYTLNAKIKGVSAKDVVTKWQIAESTDTSTVTPVANINYATVQENGSALKINFNKDASQTTKTYYIYPIVYKLDGTTEYYNASKENGTGAAKSGIDSYAKKLIVVGNAVKNVTLSQKAITTNVSDTNQDFNVYVKAFSADGKPVSYEGIDWTSSNHSIAKIAPTDANAAVAVGDDKYGTVKITTGKIAGTATVSGVLRNSGKKVSIKVTVKASDQDIKDAANIKINKNKNLSIKIDSNTGYGVKQLVTDFYDSDGAVTYPKVGIAGEKYAITPEGGTEYELTVSNAGVVSGTPNGIDVDASGNLIASKKGTYKITKTVTLGASEITMGEGNSITVTVK